MSDKKCDWQNRKLDIDWIVDSGILFEINRQYFHPFGIALTIQIDNNGNKTWGFKDERNNPSSTVFDKKIAFNNMQKFQRFLDEWGRKQMDKRTKVLGQSVQFVERIKND